MGSREALKAGRRLDRARERLSMDIDAAAEVGGIPSWRLVRAFERAAIKVGEVRERGRRSKKGGADGRQ